MEPKKRKRVYTDYDRQYTVSYIKEKKERIAIDVNKGERDMYKAFCESQGESLASMFRKLMQAEMKRTGWAYEGGGK